MEDTRKLLNSPIHHEMREKAVRDLAETCERNYDLARFVMPASMATLIRIQTAEQFLAYVIASAGAMSSNPRLMMETSWDTIKSIMEKNLPTLIKETEKFQEEKLRSKENASVK